MKLYNSWMRAQRERERERELAQLQVVACAFSTCCSTRLKKQEKPATASLVVGLVLFHD
jgi:hypothetical protein